MQDAKAWHLSMMRDVMLVSHSDASALAGCWAGLGPPASSLSSLGLTKGHVLTLLPQWFPLGEPRRHQEQTLQEGRQQELGQTRLLPGWQRGPIHGAGGTQTGGSRRPRSDG